MNEILWIYGNSQTLWNQLTFGMYKTVLAASLY